MRFYVGITDPNWFNFLRKQEGLEDVNFWKPGSQGFEAIPEGSPFLFKLKGSKFIVGLGFFFKFIRLPFAVAWNSFGVGNGFNSFHELVIGVNQLRSSSERSQELGCRVLTNPIFFAEHDWIDIHEAWKPSIQTGKAYSTTDAAGRFLWQKVEARLHSYLRPGVEIGKSLAMIGDDQSPEFRLILSKARIGQGSFRASVTDAYYRRCSISGERTLPALEAAHIKSYSESGPNLATNGLLLRSDLHKLFDAGYLTVTGDLKVLVSSRIKAEFDNGREYYQFNGRALSVLPDNNRLRPAIEYLRWHNENRFEKVI